MNSADNVLRLLLSHKLEIRLCDTPPHDGAVSVGPSFWRLNSLQAKTDFRNSRLSATTAGTVRINLCVNFCGHTVICGRVVI